MNQGVVNEDSAAGWAIGHSTITDNAGAGDHARQPRNLSRMTASPTTSSMGSTPTHRLGPSDMVLDHNEIGGNDTYNWEAARTRLRLHRAAGSSGTSTAPS